MNTATAENPAYIYLAYDTANNFVAEEVKADGSNWKIKYEGVADNASVSDLNNQKRQTGNLGNRLVVIPQ